MVPPAVVEKLESLPVQPGCYLFKGQGGAVLYIGKAKSLRSRVRSYFQEGSSDTRPLLPLLLKSVVDLETIVVKTEKEAAILENSLIKEHKPRFNVKLRDDKEFLSLRLDASVDYPRLEVVRRPQTDKARYFGPYPSATSARRTLHLVNKHFMLRTCTDAEMAGRKRPCLQYQIKRCPAPCVFEIDRDAYETQVRAVGLFLEGRHDELSKVLEARMKESAAKLQFEQAKGYRDQLRAVQAVQEGQRLVLDPDEDVDAIGLFREGDLVEVVMLYVRAGRLIDHGSFSLTGVEVDDEQVVSDLLRQYYDAIGGEGVVPETVLLPLLPEGADGVGEWLSERRGRKVSLVCPQRGKKRDLLAMAQENAAHSFKEKKRSREDLEKRLGQLQQRLRLPTLPRRIECVDISHLGGNDTVGAVVALRDGELDKKRYRVFHVRNVSGGDDYGAMFEVLSRRFRRAIGELRDAGQAAGEAAVIEASEAPPQGEPTELQAPVDAVDAVDAIDAGGGGGAQAGVMAGAATGAAADVAAAASGEAEPSGEGDDGFDEVPIEATPPPAAVVVEGKWDLPDLLVVDGGRGQLNVALQAARELGLVGLSIVGLAKERENVAGETMVDRVYLPGQKNGIPVKPQSPGLFYLAKARDEAHRFSNHAREKLGKARRLRSDLDGIAGVGEKTRKQLLQVFGTVEGIRAASDEALRAVPGVTAKVLAGLRKALGPPAT